MKLTDRPAPSDALILWACRYAEDILLPADRPWFMAPPPPLNVEHWEYLCRCRREPVRVRRYLCHHGQGYLYLGQCSRCETVIWGYRHDYENLDDAA
jgi:hypothetical protein